MTINVEQEIQELKAGYTNDAERRLVNLVEALFTRIQHLERDHKDLYNNVVDKLD
jgi:hypothetical protein